MRRGPGGPARFVILVFHLCPRRSAHAPARRPGARPFARRWHTEPYRRADVARVPARSRIRAARSGTGHPCRQVSGDQRRRNAREAAIGDLGMVRCHSGDRRLACSHNSSIAVSRLAWPAPGKIELLWRRVSWLSASRFGSGPLSRAPPNLFHVRDSRRRAAQGCDLQAFLQIGAARPQLRDRIGAVSH